MPADGQVATQPSQLAANPQVSFNDIHADVTYAGLVVGSIGLYQIDVVVPNVPIDNGTTFDDESMSSSS